MSNKIYAVVYHMPLPFVSRADGVHFMPFMPLIEAFFTDKKSAKRFKANNAGFKKEVIAICPTDYALIMHVELGCTAILAKGEKRRERLEQALPSLAAVFPEIHFEICRFNETALYTRSMESEKAQGVRQCVI